MITGHHQATGHQDAPSVHSMTESATVGPHGGRGGSSAFTKPLRARGRRGAAPHHPPLHSRGAWGPSEATWEPALRPTRNLETTALRLRRCKAWLKDQKNILDKNRSHREMRPNPAPCHPLLQETQARLSLGSWRPGSEHQTSPS